MLPKTKKTTKRDDRFFSNSKATKSYKKVSLTCKKVSLTYRKVSLIINTYKTNYETLILPYHRKSS